MHPKRFFGAGFISARLWPSPAKRGAMVRERMNPATLEPLTLQTLFLDIVLLSTRVPDQRDISDNPNRIE